MQFPLNRMEPSLFFFILFNAYLHLRKNALIDLDSLVKQGKEQKALNDENEKIKKKISELKRKLDNSKVIKELEFKKRLKVFIFILYFIFIFIGIMIKLLK